MNYCLNIHEYDAYFDQLFFKPLAIFKIIVKKYHLYFRNGHYLSSGGGGGVGVLKEFSQI